MAEQKQSWFDFLISNLNVPETRRDISNQENVRWLLKNIPRHIDNNLIITYLESLVKHSSAEQWVYSLED